MNTTAQAVHSKLDVARGGVMPRQTVAYVMNGFPRLSETFIANEVYLLERMGLSLRLFSVKQEGEPTAHPVVDSIRAPLTYLPKATTLSGTSLPRWLARNLPRFARASAHVLRRHPVRFAVTLAAALRMSWAYRQSAQGIRLRKVFIKEFLQAAQIAADVLRSGDVGHLHGHFCHGVATITWFASRLTGIPFSFTAHAKDIYQADLNPGDLLERKLDAARFVATCTCANAAVLRERHPRPDEVHAIYHGLDTQFFVPAPLEQNEVPPLILSVGRFVAKKGFDTLIAACALLREDGVAFRCLIVGERGDAYASMLAAIESNALADVVMLGDAVTQDRLRSLYGRARVFALPCRITAAGDRDGFPNVLAEAMAAGVPVVTTAISGIPEMIDDGVHGLLVPENDAPVLANALRRLLTEPSLHGRLSASGRARICDRFDSRRTTCALRDLFVGELRRRSEARVCG